MPQGESESPPPAVLSLPRLVLQGARDLFVILTRTYPGPAVDRVVCEAGQKNDGGQEHRM
jgi:hypothetical protein